MDDVTWVALTLTLTAVFAGVSWLAYQRRGLGAGLKGAGITVLPAAAYLTDTLRMFTRIVTAVGDWATGLVFSPLVWIGLVLAGMGVLLFGAGRAVDARRRPDAASDADKPGRTQTKPSGRLGPGRAKGAPASPVNDAAANPDNKVDGELDEIEALLRKRGIT